MLTQGADGKLEDVHPCIQVEAEVDVQPVHCAHQVLLPVHHLRQKSLWTTAASEVPSIQNHEHYDKCWGGFPDTTVASSMTPWIALLHRGSCESFSADIQQLMRGSYQQSVQGVNEGNGNPAL